MSLPSSLPNTAALINNRQPDKAAAQLKQQLLLEPGNTASLVNYGVTLRKSGFPGEAVLVYRKALQAEKNNAALWSNYANALKDNNQFSLALQAHQQALELDKNNPGYWMNAAIALREAGLYQKALQALAKSRFLKYPNSAALNWEKALCYLCAGDYPSAWPLYAFRFEAKGLKRNKPSIKKWRGQDLKGKTLLLVEEQGYGDIILASRFIKPLTEKSSAQINLACRPELQGLFQQLPLRDLLGVEKIAVSKADYYCDLMDLPGLMAADIKNIPPPVSINLGEEKTHRFQFISDDPAKLKIGIVWSGSLGFEGNNKRALPLSFFYPLLAIENVALFSLQKGPKETELHNSSLQPFITNLAPMLNDFSDTAAAISHLDLIVMSDSSVAHLAASMGKPVINLLQFHPYWIYAGQGEHTPWYPSMTLLRQAKPGEWDAVQGRMLERVQRFLSDSSSCC